MIALAAMIGSRHARRVGTGDGEGEGPGPASLDTTRPVWTMRTSPGRPNTTFTNGESVAAAHPSAPSVTGSAIPAIGGVVAPATDSLPPITPRSRKQRRLEARHVPGAPSHLLATLAEANCLVVVPSEAEQIRTGEIVYVAFLAQRG